jgi:hypothetical protein
MGDGPGLFFWTIIIGISILVLASVWKVFTKAGQPGWAAIVPIYNLYFLLQIVGRPGWWLLLMFIPVINIVVALIVYLDLAKSFDKSSLFGLGLFFLGFIFCPILGFGDARYRGPVAKKATIESWIVNDDIPGPVATDMDVHVAKQVLHQTLRMYALHDASGRITRPPHASHT